MFADPFQVVGKYPPSGEWQVQTPALGQHHCTMRKKTNIFLTCKAKPLLEKCIFQYWSRFAFKSYDKKILLAITPKQKEYPLILPMCRLMIQFCCQYQKIHFQSEARLGRQSQQKNVTKSNQYLMTQCQIKGGRLVHRRDSFDFSGKRYKSTRNLL